MHSSWRSPTLCGPHVYKRSRGRRSRRFLVAKNVDLSYFVFLFLLHFAKLKLFCLFQIWVLKLHCNALRQQGCKTIIDCKVVGLELKIKSWGNLSTSICLAALVDGPIDINVHRFQAKLQNFECQRSSLTWFNLYLTIAELDQALRIYTNHNKCIRKVPKKKRYSLSPRILNQLFLDISLLTKPFCGW